MLRTRHAPILAAGSSRKRTSRRSTSRTTRARSSRACSGTWSRRRSRGQFIVAAGARFLAPCGLIALPFIIGQGTNVISSVGELDELIILVVAGVIAGGIYLAFSYVADRMFAALATMGVFRLQTDLFAHLQTLSMGFFYKTPVGELLSRVNNDAEVVAQFFYNAVAQLIRSTIVIIMVVAVMLPIRVGSWS